VCTKRTNPPGLSCPGERAIGWRPRIAARGWQNAELVSSFATPFTKTQIIEIPPVRSPACIRRCFRGLRGTSLGSYRDIDSRRPVTPMPAAYRPSRKTVRNRTLRD
jgi:hypothetical protein